METVSVLVLDNLSLGRKIRLSRIAKGLRQIDLASITGLPPVDICYAELDRGIRRWKMQKIVQALELEAKYDHN